MDSNIEEYESGVSIESICRKYGINNSNFHYWERKYEDKLLSLPSEISELCQHMFMLKKEREKYRHTPIPASQSSETDRLHAEISRLRKALEYSELRNEALNEVLRIGREKYGVDLLKKLAPSSRYLSAQASRCLHRYAERTVWQKPRGLL